MSFGRDNPFISFLLCRPNPNTIRVSTPVVNFLGSHFHRAAIASIDSATAADLANDELANPAMIP
jgi:hypothetical protein